MIISPSSAKLSLYLSVTIDAQWTLNARELFSSLFAVY